MQILVAFGAPDFSSALFLAAETLGPNVTKIESQCLVWVSFRRARVVLKIFKFR